MKLAGMKEKNGPHFEHYGAGYSVFFREDKLLSYSEIYNWWKMKRTLSEMIEEERFKDNRQYRFLDIGCSRGYDIFRINKDFGDNNFKFIGFDIISKDIEFANKTVQRIGLNNVQFLVANAEEMGFEDNIFDIITCSEVMEHQEKPQVVLSECYRILRSGGIIIITTPNFGYKNFLPRVIREKFKKKILNRSYKKMPVYDSKPRVELPYEKHVAVKKIRDWVDLLRKVGFTVEELKRGSIVYGGSFFDNHVKSMGVLLILDNILDHLTYNYSWDVIIKARKEKVTIRY